MINFNARKFRTLYLIINDMPKKLGDGACTGVIIRLPSFKRSNANTKLDLPQLPVPLPNTDIADLNPIGRVYIGRANEQEFELTTGNNSPDLVCSNLNEIFVRAAIGQTTAINVIIYEN